MAAILDVGNFNNSDGSFSWLELGFESLENSSDSSRKQIFRDILGKFSSYHENVYCMS